VSGLTTVSLGSAGALPAGGDQYPLAFMETYGAVKIAEDRERVSVGIVKEEDPQLRRRLELFHGKPVEFFRVEPDEFASYLARLSSGTDGVQGGAADVRDEAAGEDERLLLDRLANDAPVVNLVNSILMDGIRRGASDIHIDSFTDSVTVRYRLDGVLVRALTLSPAQFPAVSSRLKIMANLNIMERRLPQDGRISVTITGEPLDMRVSIVPIVRGESIVLRVLGRKGSLYALSELGFDERILSAIRGAVRVPHGLFLVTGPTGSGKTTTLSALLREIYTEEKKIVSIEDPVEYVLDGVDQIQTNERIGLTFESLLRRVLRQDPDVILVGEIRDPETAELAVRAALTGHLVFATLHTNDAPAAVPRLTDMGVPAYLVGAVLKGVLSQRLVRKICPACRIVREPEEAERAYLDRHGEHAETLYFGAGCDECGRSGYRWRSAVGEIFRVDERLERMIARGCELSELKAALREAGMRPLSADAIEKAKRGETTLSEAEAAGV
jgi:general secretion pathway protein E